MVLYLRVSVKRNVKWQQKTKDVLQPSEKRFLARNRWDTKNGPEIFKRDEQAKKGKDWQLSLRSGK